MLNEVSNTMPGSKAFDEAAFENTFKQIDKNRDGKIQKTEMMIFARAALKDK